MKIARLVVVLAVGLGLVAFAGCSSAASSASSSSTSSFASSSVASPSSSAPSSSASSDGVLGESEWGDLFAAKGEDAIAFGRRVQTDLPVRAYACWQGEGGGEPIWYESPDDIRKLFNALASSGIAGEAQAVSTDDYTSFGFEFADGDSYGFMFSSMALEVQEDGKWKAYELDPSPALTPFAQQAKERTQSRS